MTNRYSLTNLQTISDSFVPRRKLQNQGTEIRSKPTTSMKLLENNISTWKGDLPIENPERSCLHHGVCSFDSCSDCYDTVITSCVHCSNVGIALLFCYFAILGVTLFIINSLTIYVGVKQIRKGKATKMDYCRTSLAVTDVLTSKSFFRIAS